MTDVAKLHLIEAHHNGSLTQEEEQQLNQLLQKDDQFATELAEYNLLLEGFDGLAFDAFQEEIQSFEAKYQKEESTVPINQAGDGLVSTKPKQFKLSRYLSIAAAVALLVFVPITYFSISGGQDAFDQLYETPTAFVVRGEAKEDKEQAYNLALSIYNKGDYGKSIELLNTYIDTYGDNEYEAIFFLASAQMAKGKYQACSMNFEYVAENAEDSSFYRHQSQWFLALAQYKLENTSAAIKLAKGIVANPKHSFYDKANKFLEQVK